MSSGVRSVLYGASRKAGFAPLCLCALALALVAAIATPLTLKAQSARGSIAVSLTIVQPTTIASYQLAAVKLDRDGRISVTGGAASRSPASLIVMNQLTRSGDTSARYEPATSGPSGYLGTSRMRTTISRASADTVQMQLRQIIVAGT